MLASSQRNRIQAPVLLCHETPLIPKIATYFTQTLHSRQICIDPQLVTCVNMFVL